MEMGEGRRVYIKYEDGIEKEIFSVSKI